jgi:hypothetical protein
MNCIFVGFFKNRGDYQPSFRTDRIIDVVPGVSQSVDLTYGWEGRVRKLNGSPSDPATCAEIKFDVSFQGMTFYMISV